MLSDDEEDDEKDETTVLNERQEKDAPIDEGTLLFRATCFGLD